MNTRKITKVMLLPLLRVMFSVLFFLFFFYCLYKPTHYFSISNNLYFFLGYVDNENNELTLYEEKQGKYCIDFSGIYFVPDDRTVEIFKKKKCIRDVKFEFTIDGEVFLIHGEDFVKAKIDSISTLNEVYVPNWSNEIKTGRLHEKIKKNDFHTMQCIINADIDVSGFIFTNVWIRERH